MERRSRPSFTLALADGTRWLIRAGDAEAERVTSALGAAMQLKPAPPTPTGPPPPQAGGDREGGRELLATARSGHDAPPANLRGPGPAICALSPLTNDAMLTIGMTHVGLAIAREAQSRGGVLLHGALAEYENPSGLAQGILLAGPGTVGKTTASSRLPPPWRSLCDDTALVVRDAQGHYWAHPWPTWSRFYSINDEPSPGGSWDVQRAVPLRAVFFLSQAPDDRAEPLHVPQATAMLMEAVQHVSSTMARHLDPEQIHALHREQLAAVKALARAIPAYMLHISLTGAFWEEIEQALTDLPESSLETGSEPAQRNDIDPGRTATIPSFREGGAADGTLHAAYFGPSMNPTLHEPDLLEVVPYDGRQVLPGDVVYFESPEGDREIVHRVIRVTPDGIRTRGDNNPTDDPYLLQTADVIGQVVMAQRGSKQRRIAGGRRGTLLGYAARLWRVVNRGASRLLRGVYHALASSGVFRRLLPSRLRPRLLVFQSQQGQTFKLVMGQREVGRYDVRQQQWTIQRPFRLFVDETRLPMIPPIVVFGKRKARRRTEPQAAGRPTATSLSSTEKR